MVDYPIIDVHIHTYPSAGLGWQAQSGQGHSGNAGLVDEYLALMAKGNIRRAVMVNMTPVTEMQEAALKKLPPDLSPALQEAQVEEIRREIVARLERRNAWTCGVAREHPQLAAFVSLDPALMDEGEIVQEVARCHGAGAHGLKLHPANQQFYPHDRRLWPAFASAQALGLPILSHSGRGLLPGTEIFARPALFADALRDFPRLNFVLAHLGWGFLEESAEIAAKFQNVFFDISAAINGCIEPPRISDGEAATLIRGLGVERVMFASDWPWYHPIRGAERVARMDFSEGEKRLLFYANAERVLGL